MPVDQVSAAAAARDLGAAFERMARVAPDASRRASRALEAILAGWSSSLDGPHAGRLAGGFPAEVVCTTRDAAARYTCEVAGPGVAPHRRIHGLPMLLPAIAAERPWPFAHLQDAAGGLEWGAWIGGRHTASADAYKLYVEAPRPLAPRALAELREALGSRGALLDSQAYKVRFVAFDPASARVELYFRCSRLAPRELGGLMSFAGLGDREDDLLLLLEESAPGPVRERLPGTQQGFSLALDGDAVGAFSFFTFASSVFGDDGMVRRRLLALAERRAWNLDLYAAVSAPLADRREPRSHHGIISWIVPRDGPPGLAVGLRPPGPAGADADFQ